MFINMKLHMVVKIVIFRASGTGCIFRERPGINMTVGNMIVIIY